MTERPNETVDRDGTLTIAAHNRRSKRLAITAGIIQISPMLSREREPSSGNYSLDF